MKKIVIIVFIFLISIRILLAQDFWQQSNGPFASNILDIFISKSNTMYISTYFDGIYKSVNNGESWELVYDNLPEGGSASRILINNKNYIFAATIAHGVFRSINNGNSWDWLNNFDSGTTNSLLLLGNDTLNACTHNGLFESSDDGNSWYSLTSNLSNIWITAFVRNSQRHIFIGSSNGVVYSSHNEGLNWDSIKISEYSINTISVYNNSIFAGTEVGIYRSLDSGDNWELLNNGLPLEEFYLIKQNLDGYVFALCWNGFYRSTNYGNSWEIINHEANVINSLVVDSNNIIYSGSIYWGRGMYKSSDNGISWQIINEGIKNSFVSSMTKSSTGNIWAGTWGQGLFFSSDVGLNWQYSDFVNKKVNSIICSGDNDIFIATSNGFYLSQDGGQSWVKKNSGLSNVGIEAMTIIDNCLYIGTYGSGVYKSCNKGSTWLNISSNLPSQTIRALTKFSNYILCGTSQGIYRLNELSNDWEEIFQVASLQTLFVDINEQIFVGTDYDGAFVSRDSGITWSNLLNNGLNALGINTFETDLVNNIYTGTYAAGIYVSHDSGNNWINLNEGLTHKTVHSFVTNSDGFIFAGTIGGGVYKSIEAITSVSNKNIYTVSQSFLSPNYPNPFNPSTSMHYSIGSSQFVTLRVYDILGKEVATLVNEEKPAGSYEVDFNARNLASGIYYYQLRAGEFVETKKMILLK